MAATYSKPPKIPRWADTGTRTEPSSGKKDTGWVFEDPPPYNYENWLQGITGDWWKWIDERFFDGATKDDLIIKHPGTAKQFIHFTAVTANAIEFLDPTTAIDQMAIQKSSSGDENQIVFVRDSSDWFATMAWDKASDNLYIGMNKSAQYDDIAGDASHVFTRGGSLVGRVFSGGPSVGPGLVLENQNSGSGILFEISQSVNQWWFKTDLVAGGSEIKHFYLDGTAGEMVFANSELLRPVTDGSTDIGSPSYYFNSAYVESIYDKQHAFWFGHLNTTTQVTNTWTKITPDIADLYSAMSVASGQLLTTVKGKYLILASIQFSNSSHPPDFTVQVKIMKDGSGFEDWAEFTVDLDSVYEHPAHLSCIVEFDPTTEYVEIWAQTSTAGETVDAVADQSTMSATLIQRNP